MKLSMLLPHAAAWMATGIMCLPGSMAFGNEAPASTKSTVNDIALSSGGLLVGQLLDDSMKPMAATKVAITKDGQTTATATTDANGVFAVTGLRGGVHQVLVGNTIENCRFWAPGTAPPNASSQLRFVPGQNNLVRGQWGPPPSAHSLAGWLTNPWVIAAVVATAIAVPVVLHNIDDDDDDDHGS